MYIYAQIFYMYVHTYMYACICVQIYYMYVCICTNILPPQCPGECLYVCMSVCMRVCVYIHTHTHILYMYIYIGSPRLTQVLRHSVKGVAFVLPLTYTDFFFWGNQFFHFVWKQNFQRGAFDADLERFWTACRWSMLYYCFTTALLLLYYCFTHAFTRLLRTLPAAMTVRRAMVW